MLLALAALGTALIAELELGQFTTVKPRKLAVLTMVDIEVGDGLRSKASGTSL